MSKKAARAVLILGDLVALIIFVVVGQADHGTMNEANPALGAFRSSWEFALVWLIVGQPLGAFPSFEAWSARTLFGRLAAAWLAAAPLAILLRFLIQSRWHIATLFLAATLGFGLLFLLAWRLLLFFGWRLAVRKVNKIRR